MPKDAKEFDVAHPGKQAPSATARPIIVSHGPMMQDPMVQTAAVADEESDKVPVKVNHEKVLEAPAAVVKASPKEEPAEEAAPAPVPEKSASEDNNVVEQATDKKKQEAVDQQIAEQAAHVAELVAQKTYFVPINVAKRQRSNRLVLVFLVVVLLAAVAAAAVYFLDLI